MPEAPREQACETVATLLRGMTGVRFWGGTYANPVSVERVFRVPAQRAEFPRICVLDGSGSRREFGTTGGVGRYVDHCLIMLYLYVIGSDAATRSLELSRLDYDVFLTLARHPMPVGNIRNFDFSRPVETDQGADEPLGIQAWPIEAVLDDEIEAA